MRSFILFVLLPSLCLAQSTSGSTQLPGHVFPDENTPQVTLEIRFISADASVYEALQKKSLIRSVPPEPELSLPDITDTELMKNGGIQLVSATTVTKKRTPVFVESLSEDVMRELIRAAQGHERSNILFAPKVTVFDRQIAIIQDTVERPFVAGLPRDQGSPQIGTADDGTQLLIRAITMPNDDVRIDLCARFSKVEKLTPTSAGPANTRVQVPTVTSSDVKLSAVVPANETLAVWGMQEKTSGQPANATSSTSSFVSELFGRRRFQATQQSMLLTITPRILDLNGSGEAKPIAADSSATE